MPIRMIGMKRRCKVIRNANFRAMAIQELYSTLRRVIRSCSRTKTVMMRMLVIKRELDCEGVASLR